MSYSNFDQVIEGLQHLNQTIENIRQKLVTENGVSYVSQDARQVALEGLQCDIGACGNWMRVLISLKGISREKYLDNWEEEYRKLIGTGLSSCQAEDLMLDYLRNTLTTKVHFKIENLFSNILQALSVTPRGRRYWHISNSMLCAVGIDTDGQEKNTLTALANLRNSFHANGIHNKDPMCVDVDGVKFEFCKGQPVKCASWTHIVVLIKANISVLESILFSTEVSNLKNGVADAFAAVNT